MEIFIIMNLTMKEVTDGEVDFISEPTVFKKGDCVKITTGVFEGFYANK